MTRRRSTRVLASVSAAAVALGIAACGSDDSASSTAQVGSCIDNSNHVVGCDESTATQQLVSDQSAPDAIACVAIGDKPQQEVTVDGGTFCAEPK